MVLTHITFHIKRIKTRIRKKRQLDYFSELSDNHYTNSVVTVPSNAEPPGANMLQNLLLLHIIDLLGALEALLPVSTLVEVIVDVNHCSINRW